MKILVSACLLGKNCKYNGGNNLNQSVLEFIEGHEVIGVCPEQLGGLSTPRLPAEIVEGVEAYSPTAIIPIIIGDEKSALQVADELLANGVLAPAIRYPTVAKGTARLRVALMATHTEAELSQTAKLIGAAIRKYKK